MMWARQQHYYVHSVGSAARQDGLQILEAIRKVYIPNRYIERLCYVEGLSLWAVAVALLRWWRGLLAVFVRVRWTSMDTCWGYAYYNQCIAHSSHPEAPASHRRHTIAINYLWQQTN